MVHRRSLLAAVAVSLVSPRVSCTGLNEWSGAAEAPAIDLYTADGDRLTLSSLRGKVVLVNFWATWCEPCVTEMPSLQKLRDQWLPRFEVLGVNYREGPARIKEFVEKTGITFPLVRDTDGAVAKAWGARIFPASYVVDRAGRIKYA